MKFSNTGISTFYSEFILQTEYTRLIEGYCSFMLTWNSRIWRCYFKLIQKVKWKPIPFLFIILFHKNNQGLSSFFGSDTKYNLPYEGPGTMGKSPSLIRAPMNIANWAPDSLFYCMTLRSLTLSTAVWVKGGSWFKLFSFSPLRFPVRPTRQSPTSAWNFNTETCEPWGGLFLCVMYRVSSEHKYTGKQSTLGALHWPWWLSFLCFPFFSWSPASFLLLITLNYPWFLIITIFIFLIYLKLVSGTLT